MLRRLCLAAMALCGVVADVRAETFLGVDVSRIDRVIAMGYNLDEETAAEIERLAEAYPESPVPGLLNAGRLYWMQNYAEWDEVRMADFEAAADAALEESKAHLKRNRDDPEAQLALALAELIQAIYYVDHRRWWPAFWKSRSSLKAMRRLAEEYPHLHDAKMPLGVAHCYLSETPAYLKPLSFLMRFQGDWETGIRYLQEARDEGLFTAVDAGYHLSTVYAYLAGDRERAKVEMEKLAEQFPGNVAFQGMLAEMERRLGDHEAARARARAVLRSPKLEAFPAIEGRALRSLAWSALGASDFELAIDAASRLEAFAGLHSAFESQKLWAAYVRAAALLGLGRRSEARAVWVEVADGGNAGAADAARERLSELDASEADG